MKTIIGRINPRAVTLGGFARKKQTRPYSLQKIR
jgi:hypothetical protein